MKQSKFNTIMILILASMFLFGFADSIDTSSPTGTDDPSEADDNMRRIQAGFQQRLDVDHIFALSGTTVDAADTGEHRKITYNVTISDPAPVASKSHLYMQNNELRYQDDSNSAFDLTDTGAIAGANLKAGSVLSTALEGTLPDGADLAAATETGDPDRTIADKAYVETGAWTPNTVYAGEQSVTFPNGLILKQGIVSVGTNTTVEVTYDVAFPNAFKTAQVSYSTAATNIDEPANVRPKSGSETSILEVTNSDSISLRSIYWWAWGH